MSILRDLFRALRRLDVLALGPSAALYYILLFFIGPAMAAVTSSSFADIGKELDPRTVPYLMIGLAALLAGYYGLGRISLFHGLSIGSRPGWNGRRAGAVFWAFVIIGACDKLARIYAGGYFHEQGALSAGRDVMQGPFYSLLGFLDWFGFAAVALAFTMYFSRRNQGRSYRLWQTLAWASLTAELVYALPTCGRTKFIIPVALYLIVRFYMFKKELWPFALWGIIIVGVLFPFGSACRNPEQLQRFNIVEQGVIHPSNIPRFSGHEFVVRMNQSYVFSKVIEADLPFSRGASLKNFVISVGPPRLLWKDKPQISAGGNEFGRKIGVIAEDDRATSLSPTVVGDWYLNFGLWGIVLGMAFLGLIWRLAYEYLMGGSVSEGGVFIYSLVWVQVIRGMEDQTALVYAGLTKVLVVIILAHLLMRQRTSGDRVV